MQKRQIWYELSDKYIYWSASTSRARCKTIVITSFYITNYNSSAPSIRHACRCLDRSHFIRTGVKSLNANEAILKQLRLLFSACRRRFSKDFSLLSNYCKYLIHLNYSMRYKGYMSIKSRKMDVSNNAWHGIKVNVHWSAKYTE